MLRADLLRRRGVPMMEESGQPTWEAIERRLRPFVAKRVPPSDVDDVVQEILLRLSRGISTLRDDERFGPWLFRVARNAVADHWRAASKGPKSERLGPEPGPSESDERDAESDEAVRGLTACIAPFVALLPSPYREAVTLTELEGLSQREGAAAVGISLSGMKSRVQRGRRQLRAMFDACCRVTLDARSRVTEFERRRECGCPPIAPAQSCAPPSKPLPPENSAVS